MCVCVNGVCELETKSSVVEVRVLGDVRFIVASCSGDDGCQKFGRLLIRLWFSWPVCSKSHPLVLNDFAAMKCALGRA